jgi:mannitol/fructose-specific phosphotransferase system IIA component
MVQAIITLNEHENRVLNIIKGKFGLKNKSEAVNLIISEYEKEFLEPELRPEFIKKMKEREKEPTTKVKDFKKHFGLK